MKERAIENTGSCLLPSEKTARAERPASKISITANWPGRKELWPNVDLRISVGESVI